MAGAMPMRPGARVRYAIAWPARAGGCATSWTVEPAEAGGLSAEPETGAGGCAAVLAGGIAGRRYRVTARAGGLVRTLDVGVGL